jgi:hypothetical protein
MPIILATQEAAIRKTAVQSQPGQKVHKYLKYIQHKTGLAEWLKWQRMPAYQA